MEAGFHSAQWRSSDIGYLLERKVLEETEENDRTLRFRQAVEAGEKSGFLFVPDQQRERVIAFHRFSLRTEFLFRFGENCLVPPLAPPVLDAFLVGDAKEPGRKRRWPVSLG